jgi:hypothetical protein
LRAYAPAVELRERADGREEGDLPGGLWFTDEAPPPPPPPAHPWARRVLSTVVVLALLSGAALVGLRWAGEADVRDVLASSTATYGRVLGALGSAADAEALAAAAALAPRAVEHLEGDLARLRGTRGERRAAVAAQVTAERDVVAALAPLERLADDPLSVWGSSHAALTSAVEDETRTRSQLRAVDAGAVRGLPDTAGAVRRAAATVGAALVDDVQRAAATVLDDLARATRTADLRTAAARAVGQREAVAAAQAGLTGAAALAAFAAALDAVAELAALTPADTAGWSSVRGRLQEQLSAVGASDDSLTAASVRARLPLVLASVDRVVAAAEQAHADWRPGHDAALAQQAADRAALQRYADAVRALDPDVAALTAAAAALRARTGTTTELLPDADALAADAERLLSALGDPPPAGVEAAHARLVAALQAVVGPALEVFEQLRTSSCTGCPASDAPSWRRLGATGPWSGELAVWDTAVADAEAAVAARALPPPPDA